MNRAALLRPAQTALAHCAEVLFLISPPAMSTTVALSSVQTAPPCELDVLPEISPPVIRKEAEFLRYIAPADAPLEVPVDLLPVMTPPLRTREPPSTVKAPPPSETLPPDTVPTPLSSITVSSAPETTLKTLPLPVILKP